MDLTETKLESPIGPLCLVATDAGLCRIAFGFPSDALGGELERRFGRVRVAESGARRAALDRSRRALDRYFAGAPEDFGGIALDAGGTDFQREVWRALAGIPRGETRSYGDIALEIRRPRAVRAVGSANRVNPLPVVVPCHRVIGSDGTLGGYAGRADRKEWLLRHEARLPRDAGSRAQAAAQRRTVSTRSRVL